MAETNFQTNLRRLIFWHHRSAREAARALGTSERTISQWLTGKRYPGGQALMTIDRTYGISPRDLDSDESEFAQRLADPDRINYAKRQLKPPPRLKDVKRVAKAAGAEVHELPRGRKR
jgi:transcriptional regulator with XRE-family HTH domain